MDLLAIKPATQKLDIRHPGTGSPTGFIIEIGSAESDAVKKVERKQLDRAIRNRSKKPNSSEIEANAIERLSATIVGWEWKDGASWGGQQLDFTRENVATVLETGWLRNQVREVAEDEASFFTN